MSIERFTKAYPVDERFVRDITRNPDYGYSSPASFMAGLYIKEGADGIRDAVERLMELPVLDPDIADQLKMNYFAMILGSSIKSIEKMIVEGEFDQYVFNSRIESALLGSRPKPRLIENPRVETIDPRRQRTFLRVAQNDRTFGDFFKDGYMNLPLSLARFLRAVEFPSYSDSLVLGFIQRTGLLIEARDRAKQEAV